MRSARERLLDPVLWTEVLQVAKTAAAAVVAWLLAHDLFGLAQPFLAPWAALLTVHATVYSSARRGAQQVGATVLGVLLAFAAARLLGVGAASLGLLLLAALAAGATPLLRAESTTAAATGLVVLLTGYSSESGMLAARLTDTVIGIGVGVLVNLAVWPPLRDRAAARRIDRIDDRLGELLCELADALRDPDAKPDPDAWIARTRALDHEVDDAWRDLQRARESGRLNVRRHARARVRESDARGELIGRLEQAVAETRSMARTIGRAGPAAARWDREFGERWPELLARLGAAVGAADPTAVTAVREDLEDAAQELAGASSLRPVHGALIVNLRNIAEAMDVVAGAQPVRVPEPLAR